MAVRPRHRRGRGQHFLRSSKLAAELVRAAGIRRGDLVLDIGAGSGVLTAALVRGRASVVAVEIDTELASGLRRRFPGVRVVEDDLLRTPLPGEPFLVRRLPRCVLAPPPSVDAGVLRAKRRAEPLVASSESGAYEAFLVRGYRDGLRSVATSRQLKRSQAELGLARQARPRDLDAMQWAGLWRAVRQSV
ncbi:MAG: methyltransferase domain-containing protein [Actinomycetota bacterium]|nr:methyltransferase domain-containing protein [Actinomycetota bacterium]